MLFPEPLGVATAAAEFFRSLTLGKTVVNGLGPGGIQDFFHGLVMQIAQRDVTLVV
jgi:hypothetical protein